MHAYFLTGGVDEVTKDSQGAHPASLITVLQLLKNKHNQPIWEGVSWRERSRGVKKDIKMCINCHGNKNTRAKHRKDKQNKTEGGEK